ncbi:hypothetical protein DPEC_G00021060 [Dallia pectoralis]|uniref:Uncharacterized protein n=1 Tax=Dallia pectoralis TaxID=75939 RepID=A0ACC2HHL2_DALPE|nr:hypothetical protein DPEC_G00021060 [Dallia pectoralis]
MKHCSSNPREGKETGRRDSFFSAHNEKLTLLRNVPDTYTTGVNSLYVVLQSIVHKNNICLKPASKIWTTKKFWQVLKCRIWGEYATD